MDSLVEFLGQNIILTKIIITVVIIIFAVLIGAFVKQMNKCPDLICSSSIAVRHQVNQQQHHS